VRPHVASNAYTLRCRMRLFELAELFAIEVFVTIFHSCQIRYQLSGGYAVAGTVLGSTAHWYASIEHRYASIEHRHASIEHGYASIGYRYASTEHRYACIELRYASIDSESVCQHWASGVLKLAPFAVVCRPLIALYLRVLSFFACLLLYITKVTILVATVAWAHELVSAATPAKAVPHMSELRNGSPTPSRQSLS